MCGGEHATVYSLGIEMALGGQLDASGDKRWASPGFIIEGKRVSSNMATAGDQDDRQLHRDQRRAPTRSAKVGATSTVSCPLVWLAAFQRSKAPQ